MTEQYTNRRRGRFKPLLTIVLVGLLVLIVSRGNVDVSYTENGFKVSASGTTPLEINYDQVESVQWYQGDFDPGVRQVGVDNWKFQAGSFSGGSLGQPYRLYMNKDYSGQMLIISLNDGQTLAIGATGVDMQILYATIVDEAGLAERP